MKHPLLSQFLPGLLLACSLASCRLFAADVNLPAAQPREFSLAGDDWQVASLEAGQGHQRRAFAQGYPAANAIAATVPGDVHWDLERAGKVPPIFYGQNSKQIGWVAGKEWWYRKSFKVPSAWKGKAVRLQFDGVDYLADVWLNGRLLLRHEGQFTPFEFDVTEPLHRDGENTLAVLVHPAPAPVRAAIAAGQGEWPVMQAMRAAYPCWKCMTNAGWDWGTKIITLGIWKDVRLVASENVYLANPVVLPQLAPPYDRATLHVRLNLEANKPGALVLGCRVRCLTAPDEPVVALDRRMNKWGTVPIRAPRFAWSRRKWDCPLLKSDSNCFAGPLHKLDVAAGSQRAAFSIEVPRPQLWWPNGYGKQHLYELEVTARAPGDVKVLDHVRTTFGIRDLKMLQNPEAADNAEYIDYSTDQPVTRRLPQPPPERKYLIQINGRKVFARGANWIPCDLLYGRPRRPFYEHLVRSAAEANFNLFRVWGGGLIDKPEFFELCDQYGIMLFQEFPNAGARLAETDAALAVTGREVRQILPALMNHPSIVRYGGGNEWYRDAANSRQMAQIRKICNEIDPTRPYHDPDPETIAQRHGPHSYEYPQHYATYNLGRPLTAGPDNPLEWTEYGASGAASVETLKSIMPAADLWPIRADNPLWIWHKAFHAYGADNWMGSAQYLHLFGELPDLETTVRASQFVQAEGLRYANQSMRRRKWHRSACASWTYNEPWPNAAHGSIIEHSGRVKMAYYYTRNSYSPVDVSAEYPSLVCRAGAPLPLKLFATSDRAEVLKGCGLTATVVDVRGRLLDRRNWQFDVAPDTTSAVGTLEFSPPDASAGSVVLVHLQLRDSEGRSLSTETYTFGVIPQTSTEAALALQVPAVSADGRRNLALLRGVKAAASSVLAGYAIHQVAHLNDGWYGNEASWIEGDRPSWAQLDLGAVRAISRVCVGNDHTGRFEDRGATKFRVLAATEYREDMGAPTWRTVATYQGGPLQGSKTFDFEPVKARWVRIAIDAGAGARLDEIEVYEAEPLPAAQIAAAKAAAVRARAPVLPELAATRACLRPLLSAPATDLALSVGPQEESKRGNLSARTWRAIVRNRGKMPALFVKLDTDSADPRQCHVVDNYFTLLADEAREVHLAFRSRADTARPVRLRAKAWNSVEVSQALSRVPAASTPACQYSGNGTSWTNPQGAP